MGWRDNGSDIDALVVKTDLQGIMAPGFPLMLSENSLGALYTDVGPDPLPFCTTCNLTTTENNQEGAASVEQMGPGGDLIISAQFDAISGCFPPSGCGNTLMNGHCAKTWASMGRS